MVHKDQHNDSKNDLSPAETKVKKWDDSKLLKITPMTKDASLEWWNAVNRQGASQEVVNHFKRELQKFK